LVEGFTKQHGVHMFVWYEQHEMIESDQPREAAQEVEPDWKMNLIEEMNPTGATCTSRLRSNLGPAGTGREVGATKSTRRSRPAQRDKDEDGK
jgi:hypothetical protein